MCGQSVEQGDMLWTVHGADDGGDLEHGGSSVVHAAIAVTPGGGDGGRDWQSAGPDARQALRPAQ